MTNFTVLGTTARRQEFFLSADDQRRHIHVLGQTGTGKSALLLNLMAQDISQGRGVALLDPHGDLAQAALSLIPADRAHALAYLDPADLERPVAFNVLDKVPPDSRPLVADNVVACFRHVWSDSWGPRLEHILHGAVRTLLDSPGTSLLCIPRLLLDSTYRARIVARVTDPVVRSFWHSEYEAYDERYRTEAIGPILNKIGRVLSAPAIRNIVAQPKSTVDLRKIMDEGRYLIVNLAKGALGEGHAHLLGALLTTALAQAALSRANVPEHERNPFHLYVDEFQSFATDSFGLILSEARKYALALTLSHQFLGQLPPTLRAAVLGNAGNVIAFRLGAEDAPLMAAHIGLANSNALMDLPNYATWSRFLTGGGPTGPIFLETRPPPPPRHGRAHCLIANSRRRFGRDRRRVEDRIARFMAPVPPVPRPTRWGRSNPPRAML